MDFLDDIDLKKIKVGDKFVTKHLGIHTVIEIYVGPVERFYLEDFTLENDGTTNPFFIKFNNICIKTKFTQLATDGYQWSTGTSYYWDSDIPNCMKAYEYPIKMINSMK
jgi:hypothetical protein